MIPAADTSNRRLKHLTGLLRSVPLHPSVPDPKRLVIWLPVTLAIGILLYFSWPSEPDSLVVQIILIAGLITACVSTVFRQRAVVFFAGFCLAGMALGFAASSYRTQSLSSFQWTETRAAVSVTGWVERVERTRSGSRALVRVIDMDNLESLPQRIRIRMNTEGLQPGDGIRVDAVLNRPGGPVMQGSYDPSRATYFDGIGLTGYAIIAPEPTPVSEHYWNRSLARFRWTLASHIRNSMPERTGGVAAALLTGDRSGIPQDTAEDLRRSGLGHILAISGLHMALLAGSIYAVMRFGFAAWDRYARAHDPRKPAAIIALFAALTYLIVSGASVPTQRAFIMTGVVLMGIVLNRRAFSLRSLSLAATIILIMAPESLMEPGFQMSFSAVAALIAVYELLQRRPRPAVYRNGILHSLWKGLAGLSTTSLVAGSATGIYAAFHFQRLAALGFIANLLAMPIFSFIVMPAGIAALVFMPFNLDYPFLWIMDKGLAAVLEIAHQTSTARHSVTPVAAPPGWIIAVFSAGFVFLVMGQAALRPLGLTICLVATGVWSIQDRPDLMITEGGVVIARQTDSEGTRRLASSSSRRDRFDQRVFLQRIGLEAERLERAGLNCDSLGCVWKLESGLHIALTDNPQSILDDCENVGLIIFDGEISPYLRRQCSVVILDNLDRERRGGTEVWIREGQVTRTRSSRESNRPWHASGDGF